MLNKLRDEIHKNNVEKGFYDEPSSFGERIALVHSELSEALEGHRENNMCMIAPWDVMSWSKEMTSRKLDFEKHVKNTVEDELADVIIRVLDMCGHMGIDIDAHVSAKIAYNKTRPYKHGKQY